MVTEEEVLEAIKQIKDDVSKETKKTCIGCFEGGYVQQDFVSRYTAVLDERLANEASVLSNFSENFFVEFCSVSHGKKVRTGRGFNIVAGKLKVYGIES